jgi:hypothetical protein
VKVRYWSVALAAALFGVGGWFAPVRTAAHPATAAAAGSVPLTAQDAGGWLGRQFLASGDLPVSEGEAGLNNLSMALVALVSAQVGELRAERGLAYLEKNFGSYVSTTVNNKKVDLPGRLAQVILAAHAMNASPTHFGGTSAAGDLVARLLATQVKTGVNAGLFGSPNAPTYSSAYTQGLALLALSSAGQPNATGAQWLIRQQCATGGWVSLRTSLTTPCPAEDPAKYVGADTNSTALAVAALSAMGLSPHVSPLKFFEHSQYPDGGFAYFGAVSNTQPVDPDSTALVIEALRALHQLSNPVFDKSANATPGKALAHFQLGCSAPASERGAYTYPGVSGPNLIATIQAIPAAAGDSLPIGPASLAQVLPTMSCPARSSAPPLSGPSSATVLSMANHDKKPGSRHLATMEKSCPSLPKVGSGQVLVPIVVDFGSRVTVTCLAMNGGATGSDVLQARAALLHTAQPVYASSGLLCSIDGYPSGGCGTGSNGHYAYWAYFHGGGKWTYASNGPAENIVSKGDVEGWRFEPNGSATAADPPPRTSPDASVLERPATAPTTTTTVPPTTLAETTTTTGPSTSNPGGPPNTGSGGITTTSAAITGTTARGGSTPSNSNGGTGHSHSPQSGSRQPGSSRPTSPTPGRSSRTAAVGAPVATPVPASQTGRNLVLLFAVVVILAGGAYAVVRSRRSVGTQ